MNDTGTSSEAAIECLLFVAGEPVPLEDIAKVLEIGEAETETMLRSLQVSLTERGSGLQLLHIAGGWQLATRAEYAAFVGRMLAKSASKLSRAALETLAIVAYRQPVTAPEIEAIRGVSAVGVMKTLQERGLIIEAGKKNAPGRPNLYTTTQDFLHYFGMNSLEDLPPIEQQPNPEPVTEASVTDGVTSMLNQGV